MSKSAQIILNLIAGLVSFVLFLILLFPLDSMISHILANLEQQTKGKGDWKISVSKIDASLIFDTEFDDFRLYKQDKEVFYAPKISTGISLMPLIAGTINVRFEADYKKGDISGRVTLASDSVIDLNIDDVSIDELTFISNYLESSDYPIFLSGQIDGDIYFAWSNDLRKRDAEVNLKLRQVRTKAIKLTELNQEIPMLVLSDKKEAIEIQGALDKNRIVINKFNIPGPDVVLSLTGNARLDRNNQITRTTIDGKFSFSERVTDKVSFIAMLEGEKTTDGYYPLSIKGNFKEPDISIGEIELSKLLKF